MASKEMIIKGVGQIRSVNTSGKSLLLGHLQDIKITFTTETENIYGGDGLLAIDTLLKNKMIEITATNAKFNLEALAMMFGGTVESLLSTAGGYATVQAENKTVQTVDTSYEITPEYSTSIYTTEPAWDITYRDTGKPLTLSADSSPAVGEFYWDGTDKKLIFALGDAGKELVLSYRRKVDVDILKLFTNDSPLPCRLIHVSSPIKQKDGTLQRIETEIYSALAKGAMEINQARASASVSTASFEVVDPERADGMLGSVKRYVG